MGNRSPALLVLLAALALLALGVYFTFLRTPGAAPPLASPPSRPSASATPVELVEPPLPAPPALAASAEERGRSEVSVAPPTPAAPPPDETSETAETDTLLLEVLDAGTNAPVPDAEVRYATPARFREPECLAQLLRSASTVRADARGLARLPVPRTKVVEVVARSAGLLGEASFGARAPDDTGERRERLALHLDWDLLVEVVDDGLQPVEGVPLRLGTGVGGKGLNARTHTGRDGRGSFEGVGHECTPGRPLRVAAPLPLGDELEAFVEREPPAGEPVRLRLPPLGSVEVAVFAADGTRVADMTEVSLRQSEPGEAEPWWLSRDPPERVSKTTRDGQALFELVPLGGSLAITAERELERARIDVDGPRRHGERVQAKLRLALEHAALVFRAVDPDGRPVSADLSINVLTGSEGSWAGAGKSSRDPGGIFEVRLDALGEGDRRELEVHARELELAARVDIGRPFPPGRHDLGDLVLEPMPLVAEGRVVDAGGSPVAGANVTWGPPLENRGSIRLGSLGSPQRVETDAAGAFALHGLVGAPRVKLTVTHPSLSCEPFDVSVGERGLEVVVGETGALAGRVLLDPGVPMSLIVRVLEQGTGTVAGQAGMERERSGAFQCRGLAAGAYTLTVSSENELLAEFPDVVVVAGEVERDPRLQEIDLRGRLHVFRIRLVRPTRDPYPGVSLRWKASGARDPEGATTRRLYGTPEIEIVTTLARIDASVRVEGYRVEHLVDLAPETEVRLRPGFPVRLVLPAGVRLPEAPLFLGVSLIEAEGGVGDSPRFFDARGEALVHVCEPGRQRVEWFLERRHRSGGGGAGLELQPEQFVVVEDRDGEQRLELALTSEGLETALRER